MVINNRMAAFRVINMSPAKHNQSCHKDNITRWRQPLERDTQTQRRRTNWSLWAATLHRWHKNATSTKVWVLKSVTIRQTDRHWTKWSLTSSSAKRRGHENCLTIIFEKCKWHFRSLFYTTQVNRIKYSNKVYITLHVRFDLQTSDRKACKILSASSLICYLFTRVQVSSHIADYFSAVLHKILLANISVGHTFIEF